MCVVVCHVLGCVCFSACKGTAGCRLRREWIEILKLMASLVLSALGFLFTSLLSLLNCVPLALAPVSVVFGMECCFDGRRDRLRTHQSNTPSQSRARPGCKGPH